MDAGANNDKREAKHRPVVEKCLEEAKNAASVERAYVACDDA